MTIDEQIDESEVKPILQGVLIKQHMLDAEIEFKSGSQLGDGNLGVNHAVTLKNKDEILELFLKWAPKSESLRKALMSEEIFQTEIYFYDEIIPSFDSMLQKHTGKFLNLTPKCFATDSEKLILVFENLKKNGYKLFDKKKHLDEEHILLVLRSYARFHGCSYILKDQYPELFKNLSEKIVDYYLILFKHLDASSMIRKACRIISEHLALTVAASNLEKLNNLANQCHEIVENAESYKSNYHVITHGDCWMNNKLFKYKENSNIPIDVKLIDFQFVRRNLPVYDLLYFFYCSAGSVEHLAKLHYYLEYYHKYLSNFIQELGSDPEKLYPFNVLKEHWRKFCKFGLIQCLMVTSMVFSKEKNMAEDINQGKSQNELLNVTLSDTDTFINRMKIILNHFIDNQFL